MTASRKRLILFTRYPVPGRTKTRLISALGSRGAADLHRRLTELVLGRVLSPSGTWELEVRFQGGNKKRMAAWLGEGPAYRAQGPGDLGRKMLRAFRGAFREGVEAALLVGSDVPGLCRGIVEEAFRLLESRDVVLGPARDGGYYLVGVKAPQPFLFTQVPWGGRTVLEKTLEKARERGLSVGLLEVLADLDVPGDLEFFPEIPGLLGEGKGNRFGPPSGTK